MKLVVQTMGLVWYVNQTKCWIVQVVNVGFTNCLNYYALLILRIIMYYYYSALLLCIIIIITAITISMNIPMLIVNEFT